MWWWSTDLKFNCLHCIHCCFFSSPLDFPIVLDNEVSELNTLALKRGINLSFIKLTDKFYLWLINGFCPFYDILKRRCIIHNNKPFSCRIFPLLLNIETGEVSVSLACDWVARHIAELVEGKANVAEVFPEEFKAVVHLFKILKKWKM